MIVTVRTDILTRVHQSVDTIGTTVVRQDHTTLRSYGGDTTRRHSETNRQSYEPYDWATLRSYGGTRPYTLGDPSPVVRGIRLGQTTSKKSDPKFGSVSGLRPTLQCLCSLCPPNLGIRPSAEIHLIPAHGGDPHYKYPPFQAIRKGDVERTNSSFFFFFFFLLPTPAVHFSWRTRSCCTTFSVSTTKFQTIASYLSLMYDILFNQEEFDTYDHNIHWFLKLQFLKKRSKIIEIVAAKDVIFALAQSGLCAAFSRTTNKRICFLNICPDEVIRSLFYNKNNESLITVSVYASDHFSSLKCRTTPIEYIRRNQLDAGFPLFETESLKWPGFVEFDDVNGKVLTYSAQDGIYKVFDLKNYSSLYSISDKNVQEIKISPGIMLLIYHRTPGFVPLKILSIEDGSVLKSFNHLLHRNKKVDFIEQFNEKLLVKQENENLQILDVRNSELTEVGKTQFMTPSAFIFLYENHLFLTFRNRTVAVWNFRGELVTSFEDHLLWHPDCNTNNIYITSDQDLIISYCKSEEGCEEEAAAVGSINMSNILTGKCIAKISANDPSIRVGARRRGDGGRSSITSTVREALEDVTALFYDEDRNEIYTGNKQGLIHVWSN